MSDFPVPPKTPPAWFAQIERRQDEQHRRLSLLESRVGTNSLATGHQVGELGKVLLDLCETMRAMKEAIADVREKLDGLGGKR